MHHVVFWEHFLLLLDIFAHGPRITKGKEERNDSFRWYLWLSVPQSQSIITFIRPFLHFSFYAFFGQSKELNNIILRQIIVIVLFFLLNSYVDHFNHNTYSRKTGLLYVQHKPVLDIVWLTGSLPFGQPDSRICLIWPLFLSVLVVD